MILETLNCAQKNAKDKKGLKFIIDSILDLMDVVEMEML